MPWINLDFKVSLRFELALFAMAIAKIIGQIFILFGFNKCPY